LVAGSSRSSLRMNSSSLNEITHGHAAAFLVCYNYHSLYDSRVQRPPFGILVTQNCHEQCFPFLLARSAIERRLIFGHDVGHGRAKSVKGCIPDYVARIVDLPPSHVLLTSGNIFLNRQHRGVQNANDAVRERVQALLVQARAEEMLYEAPNVPAIEACGAVGRG